MSEKKTHREVKNPQMSVRNLSDYMAATEQTKRTIVRGCKYQPIARLVQHDEAKVAVAKFIKSGGVKLDALKSVSEKLRSRMADSPFDRDLFDHNADYIDRFAKIYFQLEMPKAEILDPGPKAALTINGLKITNEIHFRLRRVARTNKIRTGAGGLRYAKGKPLGQAVGEWQSAILLGFLRALAADGEEPEDKLCLTLDAYAGILYQAPTDAVSRFNNAKAACASIAERWPNISPPPDAI
jgi:hypothetical protein